MEDVMTWRCRSCGGATPCGEGSCARCGAGRKVLPLGELAAVLEATEPDEDVPMTEEEMQSFTAAWAPEEGLPAGPGPARRFLTWACGALVAVLAATALVVGSIVAAATLVGMMIWLKRK